ncbi:hypothetical protein BDW02DRAFT_523164 [Decorospora gaudefroyi]|uniref:C2H2-type domain-containing protein n=1 Tax=Decorospora gaudefroyi TaxID=184978 RepID=A0A6A5KHF2_9PLEO|nr:hypothetical protein BDW02DRAFT_523164 [Decorospora gaudefroyi]
MEPPTKRLRILQSVDVDEENPDYINAKQKQQRKFKSRLESIFDKYGTMHESMSDEIDMTTNSVVVDRGHLRRLKRQVSRKETMLLDTLGLAAGSEPEGDSEEEGNDEDSEDELAPTQQYETKPTASDAHGPPSEDNRAVLPHPNTPAASIAQFSLPQAPDTPNPAANLLQLVQFPHTPEGQLAQTAFFTNLTQTINQAIQQAFTGLLPSNVRIPSTDAPLAPATPITTGDKIAPATDPKWFFPPLSAQARSHPVAQSSPLPTHTVAPRLEEVVAQNDEQEASHPAQEEEPDLVSTSLAGTVQVPASPHMTFITRQNDGLPIKPRRTSPRVQVWTRPTRSAKKYHCTAEDDIHISRQKMLHKEAWADIKPSKEKWKDWPLSAFYNRWEGLKRRNLHRAELLEVRPGNNFRVNDNSSTERVPQSPARSHHLPTPSSLEQESSPAAVTTSTKDEIDGNAMSSSAHFDDDERELLSLAGADVNEEQPPVPVDQDGPDLSADELILPSIETREPDDEDELQQHLLEDLPMRNATLTPPGPASTKIKTDPIPSSPSLTRKRKRTPINFVVSDSEDANPGMAKHAAAPFLCTACQKAFKSAKNLTRHQNTHHNTMARRKSTSIDLVGGDADNDYDELLPNTPPTTTTPYIKPEPTPSPKTFLAAVHTPKPRAAPVPMNTFTQSSSSTLDRKTYLKRVKQSWTRKAGSGSNSTPAPGGGGIGKRRSLGALLPVGMKKWKGGGDGVDVDADGGSEDELAL